MRRLLVTFVCALGLTASASTTAPAAAAPAQPASARGDGLVVTGFALGSSTGRVIGESRRALDQVDIVGASLTPDGRSVRRPTSDMLRLLDRTHRAGLRAELLLSNYSNRLEDFDPRASHLLLSHPRRTDAVAARLARMVVAGGWEGVNVDLERVRRGDARGLVDLVQALQDAMPAGRTVSIDLSAATSLDAYRDRGYAMRALGEAADVLVLMTYDYSGPTWSGPGPIGPLGWQRDAVRAALQAVPADRLDVGVAGYGYTWPDRGTGHTVTPERARRLVARDDVRATWHRRAGEWSATLDDGTRMWWSDARSYRLRVRLAERLGVHGVAVWRLGSADPLT